MLSQWQRALRYQSATLSARLPSLHPCQLLPASTMHALHHSTSPVGRAQATPQQRAHIQIGGEAQRSCKQCAVVVKCVNASDSSTDTTRSRVVQQRAWQMEAGLLLVVTQPQ